MSEYEDEKARIEAKIAELDEVYKAKQSEIMAKRIELDSWTEANMFRGNEIRRLRRDLKAMDDAHYQDASAFEDLPWQAFELRDAFLTRNTNADPLINAARRLNRSLDDVRRTHKVLHDTFREQPTVVAQMLGLTEAELRSRMVAERPDPCDECHTEPHSPSCSKAYL